MNYLAISLDTRNGVVCLVAPPTPCQSAKHFPFAKPGWIPQKEAWDQWTDGRAKTSSLAVLFVLCVELLVTSQREDDFADLR